MLQSTIRQFYPNILLKIHLFRGIAHINLKASYTTRNLLFLVLPLSFSSNLSKEIFQLLHIHTIYFLG